MFPKSINGKVRNSDVRFEVFLSQFRRGTPQIEEKKNKKDKKKGISFKSLRIILKQSSRNLLV